MTTPTKTTPAKAAPAKPESAAAKASRTAPIDFSALSPSKAAAPTRSAGAGRKAQDNSVAEGWLREAWNERKDGDKVGGGRTLTVPTEQASTLVSRLRRAAKSLDLGLAVVVTENGNKSTINFAPKVAKVYKKKES